MRFQIIFGTLCLCPIALSSIVPLQEGSSKDAELRHANHIFNSVHSSMRQWGSSLNHNGMSFFLATVPKGTQFYHGTSSPEPVEGMEWLAFEPEHALAFAHPRGPPRRGPGGPPPPPGWEVAYYEHKEHTEGPEHRKEVFAEHEHGSHPPPPEGSHPHMPPPGLRPHGPPTHEMPRPLHPQQPIQRPGNTLFEAVKAHKPGYDDKDTHAQVQSGYLHTYRTKHPLRLLYIDGMSAGKTSNGTLDTQDFALLNRTDDEPHRGMWEQERARNLCNMSANDWSGRIDGILRMEMGFEIILCSFGKDLEVVRITSTKESDLHGIGNWPYMEAVTSRYWGIGGGRAVVDVEHFVTAFAYDIDLFTNDVNSDVPMPRLENASPSELTRIKGDVTKMIFDNDAVAAKEAFNWQAIADMIIARYSTPLHLFSTSEDIRNSSDLLASKLDSLLQPYIDYSVRNTLQETERCATQFLPSADDVSYSTVAARAVKAISTHICSTLIQTLNLVTSTDSLPGPPTAAAQPPPSALHLLDKLFSYLQWTTWKYCPTCADGQLCIIPIWPMGSYEEHKEPKCLTKEESRKQDGYWGGRMGRPPGREPGDDRRSMGGVPGPMKEPPPPPGARPGRPDKPGPGGVGRSGPMGPPPRFHPHGPPPPREENGGKDGFW